MQAIKLLPSLKNEEINKIFLRARKKNDFLLIIPSLNAQFVGCKMKFYVTATETGSKMIEMFIVLMPTMGFLHSKL